MDRRKFLTKTASVGVAIGSITMPGTVSATAKAAKPKIAFETISGTPALQLRHKAKPKGQPVLYVHGATFPSALSVGYHFADGLAWEDALHGAGFDVWALDFEGFGGSADPQAYAKPASDRPIPLRSLDAAQQIARAVQHILKKTGYKKMSIIAHSWGGVPAARFTSAHSSANLVATTPASSLWSALGPNIAGKNSGRTRPSKTLQSVMVSGPPRR